MEETLKVTGLECDSCAKAVSRIASRNGCEIKSVDYSLGSVVVGFHSQAQLQAFKDALVEGGYGVEGREMSRGSAVRPLKLLAKVVSGAPEFAVERRILESSLASLLAMQLLVAVAWLLPPLAQQSRPFLPMLSLAAFAAAVCYAGLAHYLAFKQPFSCMCGMMVGMTIGMAGGFLAGAFAGAANGMFAGSLAGIGLGMGFGALAGSRSSVMGVLEGLMAGLMGGAMGAMLSVMLFNDNVLLLLAILTACFAAILAGLSYMLFREGGSPEQPPSPFEAAFWNAVFFAAFAVFLVWGPRSAFTWGGFR